MKFMLLLAGLLAITHRQAVACIDLGVSGSVRLNHHIEPGFTHRKLESSDGID
jgi:hypothetical protein